MPSACATNKNSCGISGSFATSGNFSGSGSKDPGCGDDSCHSYSVVYGNTHHMSVCQTGRYIIPLAVFGNTNPTNGGTVPLVVPHVEVQSSAGQVCVDLGKVTKDAVTKRSGFPAEDETWANLLGGAVPDGVFAPRIQVSNRSDCVAYVTTGDCTVSVEGVHHQVGVQPGEWVQLTYSPAENVWTLSAHHLA